MNKKVNTLSLCPSPSGSIYSDSARADGHRLLPGGGGGVGGGGWWRRSGIAVGSTFVAKTKGSLKLAVIAGIRH